jgi:hypothetical protein
MDCWRNLLCFKTAYHRPVHSKYVQASKIKCGWEHRLFQHETVRGVRQNVTRISILLTNQKMCEVHNLHSYIWTSSDVISIMNYVQLMHLRWFPFWLSPVIRSVSETSRTRRLFSEAAWPVFKYVETISTYQTAEGAKLRLKCDGTRAETRFRLSAKRTSPFKSAGTSVHSITGSLYVRYEGCCLTLVKQHPSYRTQSATLLFSGPQPTTTSGHYTTCCKSQSFAPEDGQNVALNMLSWSWRSVNCYCCICLVV